MVTRLFVRPAFALVLCCALAAPALAQTKAQQDADTAEVGNYRLTMEGFNKMAQAMQIMATELKNDPRFKEQQQLSQEIEQLENKDEPTEADQKRLEELQARVDEIDASAGGDLMGNAKSLDEMEAGAKKFPPLAKGLQQAGMTPREYATFMLAFIQASFAYGFQQSGMAPDTTKLTPVQQANIKFIADHEAEIKKLQESWGELGK